MAEKVTIVLVDDLDGSEASETVPFSLDGKHYEIDLSEINAANLRQALSDYVAAGRKAGKKQRRAAQVADKQTNEVIRKWGRENGYDVSDRGALPANLRKAYEAAQSGNDGNSANSGNVAAVASFSDTPEFSTVMAEMEGATH